MASRSPILTSSAFDPRSHFDGPARWEAGDAPSAILGDVLGAWLTLDGARAGAGGTLSLQPLHTGVYDRLSIFVRTEAQSASEALVVTVAQDGQAYADPLVIESRNGQISVGSLDVRPADTLTVTIRVAPLVAAMDRLEIKLGLYKASPMSDLADRYGSDKGTITAHSMLYAAHGYAEVYDRVFRPFTREPVTLLEIGLHTPSVYTGTPVDAPSLRMWSEYFSAATVIGFDRNDFSDVVIPGTIILRGNQSSRADLQACMRTAQEGFGIVIDDGSHQSSHQQISLATLFPAVRPGGLYVIEDLSWQPDPTEAPKTIDLLREWGRTGILKSPFMSAEEREFLMANVAAIEIATPFNCEIAVLTRR